MIIVIFVWAYIIFGCLFFIFEKDKIFNHLYKELTVYCYNWPPFYKGLYKLYMCLCVFLVWPLFLIALVLDYLNNRKKVVNNE